MYSVVAVSASAFGLSNTIREASPLPPPPPTDRAKRPEKMTCSLELQVFYAKFWMDQLFNGRDANATEEVRLRAWRTSNNGLRLTRTPNSNSYCSDLRPQ